MRNVYTLTMQNPQAACCLFLPDCWLLFSHFEVTGFISRTDILSKMRYFRYVSKRVGMCDFYATYRQISLHFLF